MAERSLKPGTLIVLEGLDKTGKSTQSKALRQTFEPDSTSHVHMPSGLSVFTDETYSMLESKYRAPKSGIARQLAHLACHAESVPRIQELLMTRAVVLDRWWWSTLAYGWYSGDLPAAGVDETALRNLIDSIWSPLQASVVFLFDKTYEDDDNNTDPILTGYHQIVNESSQDIVRLPKGNQNDISELIMAELEDRGLLAR